MRKYGWAMSGALFLSLTGVGALSAQAIPSDTASVVPLQPVLVNVLRTPFLLTNAPFAVAAKTTDEIQRARPGLGLDEALGGIPGVQVDDRYNYALGDRISIRGFGARSPFGVRGVTVVVDGIPATLPDGTTNLNHVDLGFLRRVEVMRGPASSLYGNSAGGVIHFESELPPAVPISQEVGVVAGSDGLLRLNSTTGGRSGGANYLLNVTRLTYDGYRDFQEAENLQLNGSLGLQAAGGDLRFVGSFVDYDANNPGSLNRTDFEADPSQVHRLYTVHQTGEDGRQGQLGASWRGGFGAGSLELAAYGLTREIWNPIPFNTVAIDRKAGGLSALYRSDSEIVPTRFNWAVGIEGDLQSDDRRNFGHSGAGVPSVEPSIAQDEQVLGGAVFAQLTAVPIERLTALAGLRYDVTRFEADDRIVTSDDPDDSGERTMDAISPSIGINYEVSEPLFIYGNIATSFETPTGTELANQVSGAGGFNEELEPQRTLSYEAGAKGLLSEWASYQVSVYRARVREALQQFVATNERVYYRNAASAVHQGVEAGVTVAPVTGVRADLAYTLTDARFDEYENLDGESLADNKIPGVSPHRLDVALSYEAPLGIHASIEGRYSDAVPVDDENTETAPSSTVVDLRFGFEELRIGGFAVDPFVGVTNLFDETYATSFAINHPGRRFFEPGPGRALYLGGQLRMGWP